MASPANSTTLSSVLKIAYNDDLIRPLNDNIAPLKEFDRGNWEAAGKSWLVPIQVTENDSAGYVSDGGNLPTADANGYEEITGGWGQLVSRFQVTTTALAKAKNKGKAAFLSVMDAEMEGAKNSLMKTADRNLTSGGRFVGFANEKSTGAVTAMQFAGDFAKVTAAIAAKGASVTLTLYRLDTWASIATPLCSAADAAAGTLTIASTDLTVATIGYYDYTAIGVAITDADSSLDYLDLEPIGIYGNLGLPSPFGLSKATYEVLRPTMRCLDTGSDGARADVDLNSIQVMFDLIRDNSDADPDQLWFSALQRNRYTVLFTGANTLSVDATKATAKDGGTSGQGKDLNISFSGIRFRTGKRIDNGLILFLKRDCWKIHDLAPPGWADADGTILNKVAGTTRYEGYMAWHWQLVCRDPRKNGVLCGLSLS